MTQPLLAFAMVVGPGVMAPGQDYRELPWRTNEQGLLEIQVAVPPTGGGSLLAHDEWESMFPGLFQSYYDVPASFGELPELGPMVALPLLCHGPGGAAAIDEAKHRMRKLGIRATVDRFMMERVRPDPLVDLLRVRWLAASEVLAGYAALKNYAEDERRDSFVRAAAAFHAKRFAQAYEVPTFGDWPTLESRGSGAAALHAGLARLPDDVHMVAGLHGAAVASLQPLLSAWRTFQLRVASMVSNASGGNVSPAKLSAWQRRLDIPGQLPYELAVRFGNWRVDYGLFAVRFGEVDDVWFHLGGSFQPATIAEGLRVAGCEVVTRDDGSLSADVYGWRVLVSREALEAWPAAMQIASRGDRFVDHRDWADSGRPPVTLFVPAAGPLAESLGLAHDGLEVRFDPMTRKATATAVCTDAEAAGALRDRWQEWQAKRGWDPKDQVAAGERQGTWADVIALPPGGGPFARTALAWRRGVLATEVRVDGSRVSWRCDLAQLPLVELVGLLSVSPRAILEHW